MTDKQIPEKFSDGWLSKLDGRSRIAQVMRDRFKVFTDDLGGVDRLSYGQRSLVERAIWLEYWLSQQEQGLARGEPVDMRSYTQSVNVYQGLMAKLGVNGQSGHLKRLVSIAENRASA